jgi:hypothetical protein
MRLFSYVVARDYGFAPNPFFGYCTLATCKPDIRAQAAVGDWVVGLASKSDTREPALIYVMRVDEILTYDAYWEDPRFFLKRPFRGGSVKHALGDNIYHRDPEDGRWVQVDSHHSLEGGSPNLRNIKNDTKSEHVLVGTRFAYWGCNGPVIDPDFLNLDGHTFHWGRGYKNSFPPAFIEAFVTWFESLGQQGYLGRPYRWIRPRSRWAVAQR